MTQFKIAVLLPCYNESLTIEKVIRDFKEVLPEATIYVYDNNSTDGTAELASKAGVVVRKEYKQGKGNVIRSMFRDIDADCYIMADGDDTYPAEHAREMAEIILQGKADMVIGDRLSSTYFTENKRPFHNIGNKLVKSLINLLFKNSIQDIMTGYRAFSYNFVKTFPILSEGFEIETEMTIFALDKNLSIENVVISYRDRPDGSESKLNTYSDGIKVLKTIGRLFKNYKPFYFFGLISFLLVAFGLALFIPVFIEYLSTGLVERFPTLIMSGFLIIAAVISFFSGIILDVIIHSQKQQFETNLTTIQKISNMSKKLERLGKNESDY
ncbi:glycosyltransferase family 2 protein [Pisciglobus halotolerans]|uniref:Glycosyltransferase involved in cell wall bisynthesis n=1 Tax=Pisciglobus halotolerans TaxID=745365 RepID=A0A1I3E5F5_9LACT|nr:glycosyltransferase family 2 protein [Pisciglobus halotolerans]SFH94204.1 Glycosyltransferase involved in cell wall bisynthesis [Pisciglobus halotolerans]